MQQSKTWLVAVSLAAIACGLAGASVSVAAEVEPPEAEEPEERRGIGDMLRDGTFAVDLRYRYESVSEDAFGLDAEASTLRTSLTYMTAWHHGFRGFLEFEDVADLGLGTRHNSLTNGIADRPVIADPRDTEVHVAVLAYGGDEKTHVRVGRQEIKLDDQRFVGNVGWRQNHQSFDAIRVGVREVRRLFLTYAYVGNINSITGANRETDSHLLDARVDLRRFGEIGAYYYYVDFDSPALASLSSSTLGAAWVGESRIAGFDVPFRVELARQDDAGDNPGTIDAGYLRAEIGIRWDHRNYLAKLGHEVLQGSAADGQFNTPLATLHKFNGWADKFGITPTNGLEDTYVSFDWLGVFWQATVALHSFAAETGGADYGDEIDAVLTYQAGWGQSFSLGFARYNADEFSTDTDKIWFYTTYRFHGGW